MKIGRGLDPFIKSFYICGLSCYPSFDGFLTGKTEKKRYTHYFPTVVLVVLTAVLSVSICVRKFVTDPYFNRSTSTLFLNTVTLQSTVFVCSLLMVFLSTYFGEICSQICIIERLSWRKFTFDVKSFQRHFMRRSYITVASLVVPVIIKLLEKPYSRDRILIAVGLAFLRALMFLILLHAFFYVDLLDHMLQCFVRHVEIRATTATTVAVQTISFRTPAAKQMTAEIFQFKLLHFNLSEISEKINHLFGWTIVIVFLQHFIYSIYNVYAAYANITQPSESFWSVLRESISCFEFKFDGRVYCIFFYYSRPGRQSLGECICNREPHGRMLSLQWSGSAIFIFSINNSINILLQKIELIEHIENLTFWAGDNEKLHFAKQELFSQMNNLEFSITGKGFFPINRKSLANVSFQLVWMSI